MMGGRSSSRNEVSRRCGVMLFIAILGAIVVGGVVWGWVGGGKVVMVGGRLGNQSRRD